MKKTGLSIVIFLLFAGFVSASNLAGNAILFDGVNDFIRIPDASHLGGMSAMTMELWYCPFDSAQKPLIIKGDGIRWDTDRSYELHLYEAAPQALYAAQFFTGTSDGTILLSNTPMIIPNQWLHIAATYDSIKGVSNLYLNGDLLVTTHFQADGITPIQKPIRDSRIALTLGARDNDMFGAYSYGMMDEVRLWNVARSGVEIKEYYNKVISQNTSGLIGYWNFDENTNNQSVMDSSMFGLNGTLGASSETESSDPSRIISTAPIVPEPASLLLLGLGGVLIRKR